MSDTNVENWFKAVDRDNSGKITKLELKSALINAKRQQFSDTTCQLLIEMFDKDKDDAINLQEFQYLFNYINEWLSRFKIYDTNQSGNIELKELNETFDKMGFNLSKEFYQFLINKYDPKERKLVTIDQFITICVLVQKFTENFKERDSQMTGYITISFEEYLKLLFEHFPRS